MSDARMPQHFAIYEQLRQRIEDGQYALADTMPTEQDLCAELSVSRYAVREALKRLDEEGFISRRRGAGTTVVSRTPVRLYRHAVGSHMDLLSYAHSTDIIWNKHEFIRTDGAMARLLGCDEYREWQKLSGVRYEETGPALCIVEAYIDVRRARLPPDIVDYGGAIYDWLGRTFGLTTHRISQDIRAYQLSADEAKALGDHPRASTLRIIRRYYDADQSMFLISINTFRAHDFVYNLRMMVS